MLQVFKTHLLPQLPATSLQSMYQTCRSFRKGIDEMPSSLWVDLLSQKQLPEDHTLLAVAPDRARDSFARLANMRKHQAFGGHVSWCASSLLALFEGSADMPHMRSTEALHDLAAHIKMVSSTPALPTLHVQISCFRLPSLLPWVL